MYSKQKILLMYVLHNLKTALIYWFILNKHFRLNCHKIVGIFFFRKHLPGRFFELNIHFGLFIGGHGNFSEIFFGHLEKFRGCISDVSNIVY